MATNIFDDIITTDDGAAAFTLDTTGEVVRNFATLQTSGDLADAVFGAANDLSFTNYGDILTTGEGSHGVFIVGDDAHVSNRGSIVTTGHYYDNGTPDDPSDDVYSEAMFVVGNGFDLSNYGDIAAKGVLSTAMVAVGDNGLIRNFGTTSSGDASNNIIAVGAGNRVENHGDVTIQTESSIIGVGVVNGAGSSVLNTGTIEMTGSAVSGQALYMFGSEDSGENRGYIHVTGQGTALLDASQDVGGFFVAGADGQLLNSGTILVEADDGAGMASIGFHGARQKEFGDNLLTNTGDIRVSGDGSAGVVLSFDGDQLVNSGAISDLGGDAVIGVHGAQTVINSGTIQGDVDLGKGNDVFTAQGLGSVAGTVFGGSGADHLTGAAGDDLFDGGKGGDVLAGGAGDDKLTGGAGNDVFFFAQDGGDDTVTDFRHGHDRLDVSDFGFADASEALSHAAQVGSSVVVTLDHDTTVTLLHTDLATLDAGDFAI